MSKKNLTILLSSVATCLVVVAVVLVIVLTDKPSVPGPGPGPGPGQQEQNYEPVEPTVQRLQAPENVKLNEKIVSWDAVEDATSYVVVVDGVEHEVKGTSFNLSSIEGFTSASTIFVRSKSEKDQFIDSANGESISFFENREESEKDLGVDLLNLLINVDPDDIVGLELPLEFDIKEEDFVKGNNYFYDDYLHDCKFAKKMATSLLDHGLSYNDFERFVTKMRTVLNEDYEDEKVKNIFTLITSDLNVYGIMAVMLESGIYRIEEDIVDYEEQIVELQNWINDPKKYIKDTIEKKYEPSQYELVEYQTETNYFKIKINGNEYNSYNLPNDIDFDYYFVRGDKETWENRIVKKGDSIKRLEAIKETLTEIDKKTLVVVSGIIKSIQEGVDTCYNECVPELLKIYAEASGENKSPIDVISKLNDGELNKLIGCKNEFVQAVLDAMPTSKELTYLVEFLTSEPVELIIKIFFGEEFEFELPIDFEAPILKTLIFGQASISYLKSIDLADIKVMIEYLNTDYFTENLIPVNKDTNYVLIGAYTVLDFIEYLGSEEIYNLSKGLKGNETDLIEVYNYVVEKAVEVFSMYLKDLNGVELEEDVTRLLLDVTKALVTEGSLKGDPIVQEPYSNEIALFATNAKELLTKLNVILKEGIYETVAKVYEFTGDYVDDVYGLLNFINAANFEKVESFITYPIVPVLKIVVMILNENEPYLLPEDFAIDKEFLTWFFGYSNIILDAKAFLDQAQLLVFNEALLDAIALDINTNYENGEDYINGNKKLAENVMAFYDSDKVEAAMAKFWVDAETFIINKEALPIIDKYILKGNVDFEKEAEVKNMTDKLKQIIKGTKESFEKELEALDKEAQIIYGIDDYDDLSDEELEALDGFIGDVVDAMNYPAYIAVNILKNGIPNLPGRTPVDLK